MLEEAAISAAQIGRAIAPGDEDADFGGGYTRLVRDWCEQRKTVTPASAYACGEALAAVRLPWCSGIVALFAAGYHGDAIGVLGLYGGWSLVQEVFPFVDTALNLDLDAPALPHTDFNVTSEQHETISHRGRQAARKASVEYSRRTLEQINTRTDLRETAALWFRKGGRNGRPRNPSAGLDPIARQVFDIASNRALSLDLRERLIRAAILHSDDLEQ